MANPFPDVYPDAGWEPDLESLGDTDMSPDGILQLNVYDPVELFRAVGHWKIIPDSDLYTLIRPHYLAQKDSNAGFGLFDFDPHAVSGIGCGVGNGSNVTFTIPAKSVTGQTVKDNGSTVSPSSYSILAGAGTDGQDQILFMTPPANTHVITCDATMARLYYTALYVTRKWSPRSTEADLRTIDLEFVQKVAG
jgi:hypothetical protein